MVITYESKGNRVQRIGQAADLTQASKSLPAGSYTTFRTYGRDRVLRLSHHLRRLEESVLMLDAPGTLSDAVVRSALGQILQDTGYTESRFRLTFVPPRLFLSVEPFIPYPRACYENGVWCATVTAHREQPHVKSTTFIAPAGDAYQALPREFHEGLIVSSDGRILEGLSSSFFALLDGVLYTEQGEALVGITQSLVLELVKRLSPEKIVAIQAIRLDSLCRVSECFITSVSREIMPVVRIDSQVIAAGVPGECTNSLMQAFQSLIQREALSVCT